MSDPAAMQDPVALRDFDMVFDDGTKVRIELKSRDLAKAERLGIDVDKMTPIVGAYALAHIVLQRLKRTGVIDIDIPKKAVDLEDIADIITEDADASGEGSTRDQSTG